MLKNYILASLRNLKRKVGFTIVNVLGLALGIATCLVIFLFVRYDLSYDDFQKEEVYRIWLNRVYPEREVDYAFIPHSISPQLVEDFPEVEYQARLFKTFAPITIKNGNDSYNEREIIFADSSIFNVIEIPLAFGDVKTALTKKDGLIITENAAEKLFGEKDVVGRQLEFPGGSKIITAVAHDYPKNSHFGFEYIIPSHATGFLENPNWLGFNVMSYIKLRPGTPPSDVEKRIPAMLKQYADGQMRARNGISFDEYLGAGNGYNYHLQSIKDIHLYSKLEGELQPNGDIAYIYIFSSVAVFILLIACINFMNLSTARSTERAKEVGIRKVLGSGKEQLIAQFLVESVLLTSVAACLAMVMTYAILPFFNTIADRPLDLTTLWHIPTIVSFLGIIILIGLLAGLYPAFFISSFAPVKVLKGKLQSSGGGIQLRNVLVILQFTISIGLISATLIVYNQMNFLLNKPLGFERENIVVIENAFGLNNQNNGINMNRYRTFASEARRIDGVQEVGFTSAMPGDILPGYIVRLPGAEGKESLVTRSLVFDQNMPEALGMTIKTGRFFSRDYNDSLNVIINESAVRELGLVNAVGKKIQNVAGENQFIEYTIVGVIEDFHFQSLHHAMEPLVLLSPESAGAYLMKAVVRLDNQESIAMEELGSLWERFVPDSPFQSYYLDSNLENFYQAEKATGKIFTIFTSLAILIASIGLLGLSAFITNQRIKEIGIRKVLGASIPSILLLLSKDLIKLILVSAIVAIPLSYIWMKAWIEDFAYSTGIEWSAFVIAALTAFVVGIVTISFQSIRAALANPVDSLKDE